MLAETYRSRTYLRPFSLTLVLKTRRHTGDDTSPHGLFCYQRAWPSGKRLRQALSRRAFYPAGGLER